MALSEKEVDALVEGAASGFRRCIIASPGCKLIEMDFSAIEAVILAWFANDPAYYRFAKLGVHAIMASQILAIEGKWERIDESWDDAAIKASASALKASKDARVELVYNASKRTVHMSGYGATPAGMHDRMPSLFPTRADAAWFQNFYFSMAPKIKQFQLDVQTRAAKQHYLGGPGQHPFSFKHWFWNVHNWVRVKRDEVERIQARGGIIRTAGDSYFEIKLGEDAKRCVAFLPQSTAAAIIRMCALRLFATPGAREEAFDGRQDAFASSCINDLYFGQMPLRAIIHDSFLLEVPEERCEEAITKGLVEMRRPVLEMPLPWAPREFLTLDADVKWGINWAPFNDDPTQGPINLDGMKKWKPANAPAADISEAALDKVIDEADLLDDDEDEGEDDDA